MADNVSRRPKTIVKWHKQFGYCFFEDFCDKQILGNEHKATLVFARETIA